MPIKSLTRWCPNLGTDMAPRVNKRNTGFSQVTALWGGEVVLGEVTLDGERDARSLSATMDHSDIRGLVTALHRYVAGLPRSSVGDHHFGMPT